MKAGDVSVSEMLLAIGSIVVMMAVIITFSPMFYLEASVARSLSASAFASDIAGMIDQASGIGGGFQARYDTPKGLNYNIIVDNNRVEVIYESGEEGYCQYAGPHVKRSVISSAGISFILITKSEVDDNVMVEAR